MDLSRKESFRNVLNMTLDEYIHASGIFRTPIPPPYKSSHDTEDRFEDFTDEIVVKEEEEEEEEEDVEMCQPFDLRNKISSNNPNQLSIRSQQWRLLPPNQSQNKPSGMPPLVPNDRESISQLNNLKSLKHNNQKRGNRWNYNNRNRRQQHHNHRNNGHTEESLQSNSIHQRTGCRPLKNFARNNNTIRVGIRDGFEQRNQHNRQSTQISGSSIMNMTIEESLQNCVMSNSLGGLQRANIFNDAGAIKLELMPYLAEKILETFVGLKTPKYDIEVQKEIHNLQNKTMTYKCPGGDVVSSDGPGLKCKLRPTSTGISLNQRFA